MKRAIFLFAISSCTTASRPLAVRFANAPAVMAADDRHNVATRPDNNPAYNEVDFYDRSFTGPLKRGLSLPTPPRALGVNALDEVPDSTWFTNRIGMRDLTPAEIAKGAAQDDGPEAHKPWTITSTKPGGTELGFVMHDARGVKYLISFDDPSRPEMETGAAIIVNRLLWAAGYNVPAEQIAYVRPDELVLAPDAQVKDHLGHVTGRLDQFLLIRQLAHVWHTSDGQIRVFASRYLPGESIGGSPPDGVRDDDPNDRIPHERRRDLRGQYPIFAWLDHVDLVQSNFLDMWTPAPGDPTHHYVVHYKVDFGKSLGTMGVTDHYLRVGRAYSFDWGELFKTLFTLGLWPRPWGQDWAPALIGVSPVFTSAGFDPGAWKPDIPYTPFLDANRFDMFWGAKLMARFTRDDIHAAVEAARYSDPRTVEYLTDTLVARQRATLRHWFARVNPLDRFAVVNNALCFDDLAIGSQLAPAAGTSYQLASYDSAGRAIGAVSVAAAPSGPTCTHAVIMSTAADSYTMVRITTQRPEFAGSTMVHLARGSTGEWRVIGVWRL